MENSKIEWTDHTWNPWMGCTKVSPGCKFCYAETLMDTRYGKVEWGPQGKRVRTSDANWRKPLAWNRAAEFAGQRARVFCASLADVFEVKPDQALEMERWRGELWDLIDATPWLDWLLLTKRPETVAGLVPYVKNGHPWPDNVWLGTSVENQKYADERIPELLKVPAAVRFLSCEPLLGPVDLSQWLVAEHYAVEVPAPKGIGYPPTVKVARIRKAINWVIVGGESGRDARPMHPDWARSLRDQCLEAGVPFFFKQWGEWSENYPLGTPLQRRGCVWTAPWDDGVQMWRVGKKLAARLLDGREWNEFPQAAPNAGGGEG